KSMVWLVSFLILILLLSFFFFFFFSSRRRHTRWPRDWSSDVCSSDLPDSGQACTPTGSQPTTIDCRPNLGGFQAPLPINITPLTTGPSMISAANGLFCPGQNNAGAFGKSAAEAIKQQGVPAGDLTDGMPHAGVLGYN